MDLTLDELDSYLRVIFTGVKFVTIDNKFVIFKQPNNLIKLRASLIYNDSFSRACKEGLLPRKELEVLIDKRSVLTDEDKLTLSKLESKLEGQQVLLSKTKQVKANQDKIKKVVDELTAQIREIKFKRTSKLLMAAEVKAEEERYSYLCSACTYTEDERLYWKDFDTYIKDINMGFKTSVLNQFSVFINGISTDVIRCIARSNLWRIRYITSMKTSELLFGVPTSEYSDDMLNLVFWSNFYQNIYEMMSDERPSEAIIEDDSALDAYMKDYYREKDTETKLRAQGKNKGSLSALDKDEVIITRSNELYEEIQYDTPRESQRIHDRASLKKKVTKHT